ncbi:PREDICTED: transcription factor bHLH25-like [Tarenaya hassleriana]|uniref:transcription factor bHLH25-like n=1 Tax=Tarenaya hassleriana TaxID=28532 RepID=UPI00053C120E|nr:PREDICTED: transcription factor bHLH25-like [Tarenaya hassleriana]
MENEDFSFMQQQWRMMNPTEERNDAFTLPSLPYVPPSSSFGPNMEQLFFSSPSPVKPRSSYTNRVTGLNDGFGNLHPKQENLFRLNPQRDVSGSKNASRGISQAKDHIIAERRRREKLSQRFIALSTLVPGLKKTDKASVLGESIKYLKHLQEKVRFLEGQAIQKTMESVVYVSKSRLSATAGSEDYEAVAVEEPLPEIEARFSGRNVMIRIHCERRKGVVETTSAEIERIQLTVINSSVMTFGSNFLHLIIIAEMGMDFSMTAKDVAKSIKSSLEFFMKANIS